MKLFYYQLSRNFGDLLNLWLWPKLLPGVLDDDANSIFIGIGTLLNDMVPDDPYKVVFGAGVGYGKGIPTIDRNWNIYCVRGPLSAQALALDPELGITDSAVLLRKVNLPKNDKLYPISFMPHRGSIKWGWQLVCQNMGLHFIDPEADVEQVLHDIQCSELIIAEAMHGAIVADALRVPWIPVTVNKGILEFKWHDWCQSLGLDYKPVRLPRLYSEEGVLSRLRDLLRPTGCYNYTASKFLAQMAERGTHSCLRGMNSLLPKTLEKAIKTTDPILSSDQAISSVTSRLEEKVEQFKIDYAVGRLNASKIGSYSRLR